MKIDNYLEVIDFSPMFEKIEACGLKFSFFLKKIGNSHSIFNKLKDKEGLCGTDLIATVAAYCRCPVSELVKFKGIEESVSLKEKFFICPETFEGKVTYAPLRETVKSWLQEGQTIQDLYDKVEKLERSEVFVANVEKAMVARNLSKNKEKTVDENGVYIDKTGRKRRSGGLSSANRAKLNRDEPVNFRIIYELCKILHCNVDFVMGWK